jgi:hypothetical protein
LKELEIKSVILDRLNLPLSMYAGYIGRLMIHIPWKHLATQPIEVEIDDVQVLLGTDLDKVVVEENPGEKEKRKQAMLKEMEEHAKREFSKNLRKEMVHE